jgi:heterodisulfide reductase subunit C
VLKLHQAFLDSIRLWGRLHELTMLLQHKLTSRDLLSNLDMGLDMFRKGKIHPLPKRIQGIDEVKKLFQIDPPDQGEAQ